MVARLKVTEADRAMLESWLRTPTLAQGLALRARVILASADGEGVRPMARRLEVSPNTVAVWRRRYRSEGLSGLRNQSACGSAPAHHLGQGTSGYQRDAAQAQGGDPLECAAASRSTGCSRTGWRASSSA